MNVGHMFRLQGRWEEAKEKYQVVLMRRPSFAIIRHHLAYVNEQLMLYKVNTPLICLFKSAVKPFQEAEDEYKKVLETAPHYGDTRIALAKLLSSTDGIKKSDMSMNSQKRLIKVTYNALLVIYTQLVVSQKERPACNLHTTCML